MPCISLCRVCNVCAVYKSGEDSTLLAVNGLALTGRRFAGHRFADRFIDFHVRLKGGWASLCRCIFANILVLLS